MLFALPVCLLAGIPLLRFAFDPETYLREHDSTALRELPLAAILLALGLLAAVASILSLRCKPWVFLIGWLANALTLAFLLFMAFWFRLF